ncbi:Solute carrier family 12 member 2 [Armadillidium nasatum]|uniref:Solute carrier family 12 member 2 n=1 Tax=Armadillidium nasatum TaxID=96803 RepID=A0A5N5SKJ3_9CRUS|nr:Solute carrier family 12 member 2 [Armadillidium nasatum]
MLSVLYNVWVSLVGAVASLFVMFLTDWITAILTLAVGIALFMYVKYKQPEINWGSTLHGQSYLIALKSSLDLVKVPENVKNYRPQILVLSGNPCFRPPLVHFANNITSGSSFLACANIVKGRLNHKTRQAIINRTYKWFEIHKVRSFYTLVDAKNLAEGSRYLFQFVGLGNLRPNMVLLGYKSDWRDCDREDVRVYFNTLHEALNFYLGIAILRVPNGLDYSDVLADETKPPQAQPSVVVDIQITPPSPIVNIAKTNLFENGSNITNDHKEEDIDDDDDDEKLEVEEEVDEEEEEEQEEEIAKVKQIRKSHHSIIYKGIDGAEIDQSVIQNLNRFKEKQPKGTIDVWWLYDDGGLTLLLPYILAKKSQWSKCKLRVIALANRKNELDVEHRKMINLLAKFRIDVKDVIILPEVAKRAEQKTRDEFEEMISKFRVKEVDEEKRGLWITDEELSSRKEKTNRHLRIRELLLEHSKEASLIDPPNAKNKQSQCPIIYGLVGNLNERHATILIGKRKPTIRSYFLLIENQVFFLRSSRFEEYFVL